MESLDKLREEDDVGLLDKLPDLIVRHHSLLQRRLNLKGIESLMASELTSCLRVFPLLLSIVENLLSE